jgi:hypothetical protein
MSPKIRPGAVQRRRIREASNAPDGVDDVRREAARPYLTCGTHRAQADPVHKMDLAQIDDEVEPGRRLSAMTLMNVNIGEIEVARRRQRNVES